MISHQHRKVLPVVWGCLAIAALLSSCANSVRFTSNEILKKEKIIHATADAKSIAIDTMGLNQTRKQILEAAMRKLGVPYCYGGEGVSCYDCSGFVRYAYQTGGIILPRTVEEQRQIGDFIDITMVEPGDIVFFDFSGNGKADHAGIYIGNMRIIHASSSRGVSVDALQDGVFMSKVLFVKKIAQ